MWFRTQKARAGGVLLFLTPVSQTLSASLGVNMVLLSTLLVLSYVYTSNMDTHAYMYHTHTHTHIYVYVCVCVFLLLFSLLFTRDVVPSSVTSSC